MNELTFPLWRDVECKPSDEEYFNKAGRLVGLVSVCGSNFRTYIMKSGETEYTHLDYYYTREQAKIAVECYWVGR